MTAQEKEQILKEAGFIKWKTIIKKWFLYFHKYTPVKSLSFIKGISKVNKLKSLEPTMKGKLSKNRFLLEVDGNLWIKQMKNG